MLTLLYFLGNQMLTSDMDNIELTSSGSVILHRVDKTWAGQYTCVAQNSVITITTVAKVTITTPQYIGVDTSGRVVVKNSLEGAAEIVHTNTNTTFKVNSD